MMSEHKPTSDKTPRHPGLPVFWPMDLAFSMLKMGEALIERNVAFALEAQKLTFNEPRFASANTVRLDLPTLRLRDFSAPAASGVPTIVVAPFAGRSAVIADHFPGQSLVETLLTNGVGRVFVTDWKSADDAMKDFDIDRYLSELLSCVEELGGRVNLVGLCQGGWHSTMLAARFPDKVNKLVLAGAPIDTQVGDGRIREMSEALPSSFYETLVSMGNGLVLGQFILQGWKIMHPELLSMQKYIDLYTHMHEPDYVSRMEAFEAWREHPINLPGRWYLQTVEQLFKANQLARGEFVALEKQLDLHDITCPTYLLAGEEDDVITPEQVFAAEKLIGTPAEDVVKVVAPGGHIGLFMGKETLANQWPAIGQWLAAS